MIAPSRKPDLDEPQPGECPGENTESIGQGAEVEDSPVVTPKEHRKNQEQLGQLAILPTGNFASCFDSV